ncbi:MAG: MFS transporter [Gemmataceae bacterium]|nr:MFS transporter [Gemmataceae bacterium]
MEAATAGRASWRWWVCGTLLLATLLNYMDRQALPQTATELKQAYGLSDARYGRVERNFSWAFAVGSILFGWLADRYGPRLLYPLVLTGWSIAGLATPLLAWEEWTAWLADPQDPSSGAFRWLLLCRTLLGLFEAGHWPCALITVRHILTDRDRPLGNGILQSGASLGAILIPIYVLAIRHAGGDWPWVFWTIGAAGLAWVPLWLMLMGRRHLATWGSAPEAAGNPHRDSKGEGGRSLGLPWLLPLLVLAVTVSCLNVSWQFLRAWLPKYLKEAQHFSADAADLAVAGYYLAADGGCLLAGVVVRLLTAHGWTVAAARRLGFVLFTLMTLLAVATRWTSGGWLTVTLLWLAGAGILGLHPFYYALVQELPQKYLGVLSGLLAAAAWFIAGAVQQHLGTIIDHTGSYNLGLTIAGAAPMIAALAVVFLWRPPRTPAP